MLRSPAQLQRKIKEKQPEKQMILYHNIYSHITIENIHLLSNSQSSKTNEDT